MEIFLAILIYYLLPAGLITAYLWFAFWRKYDEPYNLYNLLFSILWDHRYSGSDFSYEFLCVARWIPGINAVILGLVVIVLIGKGLNVFLKWSLTGITFNAKKPDPKIRKNDKHNNNTSIY